MQSLSTAPSKRAGRTRYLRSLTGLLVALIGTTFSSTCWPGGEVASSEPTTTSSEVAAPAAPSSTVPAGAPAPSGTTLALSGYGWGHGRGMGQWGAYGYASMYHWGYRRILAHFYQGATLGQLSAEPMVSVHLSALDGVPVAMQAPPGRRLQATWPGAPAQGIQAQALKVAETKAGWGIYTGRGCTGPWSLAAATLSPVTVAPMGTGPVSTTPGAAVPSTSVPETTVPRRPVPGTTVPGTTVPGTKAPMPVSTAPRTVPGTTAPVPVTTVPGTTGPGAGSSSVGPLVGVCLKGSALRLYQGSMVVGEGGVDGTTNILPLEQYVDGVVPAEAPASWAETGGLAALEAQAVAARSYGLALVRSGGQLCDNTACQEYLGWPEQYGANADAAVQATQGQVLYCQAGSTCGQAGSIALAEYSASTGGYSAGGAFPAVPDLGDSVPGNPVHQWVAKVNVVAVSRAFPGIGAFTNLAVTRRDGIGAIGGRALQVTVTGSKGQVVVTGEQASAALNLPSSWFEVIGEPQGKPGGGTTSAPTTSTSPATTSTTTSTTSTTSTISTTSTTAAITTGGGAPAARPRAARPSPVGTQHGG